MNPWLTWKRECSQGWRDIEPESDRKLRGGARLDRVSSSASMRYTALHSPRPKDRSSTFVSIALTRSWNFLSLSRRWIEAKIDEDRFFFSFRFEEDLEEVGPRLAIIGEPQAWIVGETASWPGRVRANANAGLIIQARMDARFANSEPMVNYRRIEGIESRFFAFIPPTSFESSDSNKRFFFLQVLFTGNIFLFDRLFSHVSIFDISRFS